MKTKHVITITGGRPNPAVTFVFPSSRFFWKRPFAPCTTGLWAMGQVCPPVRAQRAVADRFLTNETARPGFYRCASTSIR